MINAAWEILQFLLIKWRNSAVYFFSLEGICSSSPRTHLAIRAILKFREMWIFRGIKCLIDKYLRIKSIKNSILHMPSNFQNYFCSMQFTERPMWYKALSCRSLFGTDSWRSEAWHYVCACIWWCAWINKLNY